MKKFLIVTALLTGYGFGLAQSTLTDSVKVDYGKVYAYCLNANVAQALELMPPADKLSDKDKEFTEKFNQTFAFESDQSDYLESHSSEIDTLLILYHDYWRKSLLDTIHNYDTAFITGLFGYFSVNSTYPLDSLEMTSNRYLQSKGLFGIFGKIGSLYDLIVWREQNDTTYTFRLNKQDIEVKVVFMEQFITLGWEEYATLGRHYPGGWATSEALFCVKKAYDLQSENFLISYLAHEGRHFQDYKLFPELKGAGLEFRAKLTELSLSETNLYRLIEFFIENANANSTEAHPLANYNVISSLSKEIFKKDFEPDMNKWKLIPYKRINKTASKILRSDTKRLMKDQG